MSIIRNPILKGFYPDPSICRVGEDYYLVNSTFGFFPGIPIFHSRDLKHWTQIGNVLERSCQLPLLRAASSDGIFAPTIRYHDGTFYVITTNVSAEGNFYVTAKDPAGPWSDPVWLSDAGGIDPTIFFDTDGRAYYLGTKERREGQEYFGDMEIYIQELDLAKGKLIGESTAIWHGSMRDSYWPEGPHLYHINGKYYLMIAEGGTEFAHSVSIARSDELLGPYEGYRCNPIITQRHLGHGAKVQNAGHADLVKAHDGSWYMVLLASRFCEGAANLGRETYLAKVEWEDGWPVVNPGAGMLTETVECSLEEIADGLAEWSGQGYCYAVDTSRCRNFGAISGREILTLRGRDENIVRIDKNGDIELALVPWGISYFYKTPAFAGIRQDSYNYVFTADLGFSPENGDAAGILIFQNEEYYLRLGVVRLKDEVILRCVAVKERVQTELSAVSLDKAAGDVGVSLRFTACGQKLCADYRCCGEEVGEWKNAATDIDTTFLSTQAVGWFTGCIIGPYATGSVKSSGTACFTNISYEA